MTSSESWIIPGDDVRKGRAETAEARAGAAEVRVAELEEELRRLRGE